MRLFIAINFSEEIKDSLCDIMLSLKSSTKQGNFTHRENLHLTLVFLGEIAPARIDYIKRAMDKVSVEKFKLTMGGLGNFRREGGDIYWIGVDKNPALEAIHRQLCADLTESGFCIEKRDFKPHLTIGRQIRMQDNFNKQEFIKTITSFNMNVDKISLMKSERINGKLTYTEVYGKSL